MYLSVKQQIVGMSVREYQTLRLLCRLSKNLYNESLYSVRQFYFAEKKYLNYVANYHVCKDSENYKSLGIDIAQQTMKVVDRAFKSFFSLIVKAKTGSYQFNQISLPHYLDKEGFFSLILPTAHVTFKDGFFVLPMARAFKKEHCELKFRVPPQIDSKSIKEIRIHPKHKAQFFELEFVYAKEPIETDLNAEKFLGIDLGLDNLATCVTSDGSAFIVDGKNLKSYNRLYNKENARLQAPKDKQGIKGITRRQYLNLRKRNRRVNHAMSVAARRIVNYCIENRIGNIVVGYNPDWKREINISKQNNQNFVQIPHGKLREKLKYLCELYGIVYVEQEESYTSKASFFDDDFLPTYDANNSQPYKFSGRRITRGQYKSATGTVLNADVNGALNIL
ncbi:MAG: transposase [Methanobrevibacter sp.]|nr:transposase [Methanobrevibacter sp.]